MGAEITGATLLELLPQQEPFRFVDEIVEVDEEHIVARYTFRPDADFYRGHFPGNPITPGVLLTEQRDAVAGFVAQHAGELPALLRDGNERPVLFGQRTVGVQDR